MTIPALWDRLRAMPDRPFWSVGDLATVTGRAVRQLLPPDLR
jgi:hypothetical protein